ncbi:MAG: tripartite tricarboxylate transporter substrate binding protein, partial [Burkholderiales bacterium]
MVHKIQSAAAAVFLTMASGGGYAQTPARESSADAAKYPSRLVRMTVGFTAGGAVDVSGRLIAQRLTEALGQSVIIENRPGVDGILAGDFVAKSPPDGYTLAYVSSGHTMNPPFRKNMPYQPVKDFAPVSMVAVGAQTLVVNPTLPVHSVKQLVALARARPGQINFASSGAFGPTHLAGELLKSLAHIDIVHVPYKGGGQVVNDVIAGQCEMTFIGAPVSLPQVRAGRLRLLAVTTPKRLSMLPDVPTVAESGYPDFNVVASYSVLAPAGTPAAIVTRLSTELAKIANQPEMRERLATLGIEPVGSTPE